MAGKIPGHIFGGKTHMNWRILSALLAGLAVQLGVKLFHLIQLVVFHDLPPLHHDGPLSGLVTILLAGLISGLAVGAIAQARAVPLGALNAVTPLGFYVLYYLGFLTFGYAVAGGDSGFVGALITLAWQKLWLRYTLHFAAGLLASIAGASIGAALNPRPRAA